MRGLLISNHHEKIPAVGLEPTLYCYNQILSLACLPFHHAGVAMEILINLARLALQGFWWTKNFIEDDGSLQSANARNLVEQQMAAAGG